MSQNKHFTDLHLMKCQCNDNKLYMQSLRSPCGPNCESPCTGIINKRDGGCGLTCNGPCNGTCGSSKGPTAGKGCGCSGKSKCGNKCGFNCKCAPSCKGTSLFGPGPMTAVIDDANELTYFYGNILHENYHVPEEECQPFFTVPTTSDTYANKSLSWGHEHFAGVYPNDNIELSCIPSCLWPTMVFRNGLKQREGEEFEYSLDGRIIHFNFDPLQETDQVEVYYRYLPGEQ